MVLANPLKTCAIASARIKSDRVDARDLTHLLRGDPGAECYVPPRELREIRALVRHRAALVHMRATVKNRVQAIIDGYGFRCTHSDMFDKGGLRWLKELDLGYGYRRITPRLTPWCRLRGGALEEVNEA